MIAIEVWRVTNILLAAWLLSWVVVVREERKHGDDPLHGEWLANGLGLLMLAVIVGTASNVYMHRVFTIGLPFTTAGLLCLAYARRLSVTTRAGRRNEQQS